MFDVLSHLVENRSRVVPKTELLDTVWGDRFVSESTLTSRIKAARRVVGDDGIAQNVIKTVHGRGYRWVADVGEQPAAPAAVDHVRPELVTRRPEQRIRFCRTPGRRAARLRHGRRGPAAGPGRALDHAPRPRVGEPGVAALDGGPLRGTTP